MRRIKNNIYSQEPMRIKDFRRILNKNITNDMLNKTDFE